MPADHAPAGPERAAGTPGPTTPGEPATGASAGGPPSEAAGATNRPVLGTRTSHAWVALAAGLLFLVVVLVFILQNLKSVRVHFFWATWTVPLAVDLLLAAVLGALVVFTAGSLRIVQLRRAARRGPGTPGRRR